MADNFDPLKNKYSEPQHQASSNRASNKNSSQLPRQQSDPNGSNAHQPLAAGLPYQSQNVKVIEQQTQPYWESHEDSFENCGRDGAEGYPSKYFCKKIIIDKDISTLKVCVFFGRYVFTTKPYLLF